MASSTDLHEKIEYNFLESYRNNPNLRRSNVRVEYTPEQIEEYIKCANDHLYFIENYVKIIHVDKGLIPFNVWDYQKRILSAIHENRYSIGKLPRQSGKSVTIVSYILWLVLFNQNYNVGILANKGALARELLEKIQLAFEHLPHWLQQGVVVWNKGSIKLENGSKILASGTSANAVRGGTFNFILLDEFAFVSNNIADAFFASVFPTISSGKTTKLAIISTPLGMNHFYKMVTEAKEKRSEFAYYESHWPETPGRDEAWKEATIRNIGEVRFAQEYSCDFVGSQNTLISGAILASLTYIPAKAISPEGIHIFEYPEKNRSYVLISDTSRGTENDYSASLVVDCTEFPYRVVCRYRSNTISPLIYPDIVARIAKAYNDAYILVENNDIGSQVLDILHSELEVENLLATTISGRSGQVLGGGFGGKARLGVRTTTSVKRIGCSNLKDLVEFQKIILNDYEILNELSTFISVKNSFEADEDKNDDLVMCLVLFSWALKQTYFQDLLSGNIRTKIKEEQERQAEEDVLPFGFIDNGMDVDDGLVLV